VKPILSPAVTYSPRAYSNDPVKSSRRSYGLSVCSWGREVGPVPSTVQASFSSSLLREFVLHLVEILRTHSLVLPHCSLLFWLVSGQRAALSYGMVGSTYSRSTLKSHFSPRHPPLTFNGPMFSRNPPTNVRQTDCSRS